ncbi:Gfo/Idh/MocA family protein [Albidovulum sp.]
MKVLVAGTGFAGQGHADAFRAAGVEVAGIVGRTPEVVREVAARKNIPYAGTDWQAALHDLRPEIVSIATPGGAHHAAITQALALGCHVFVDKPMTHSGPTAVELYRLARQRGVKTAYAASFRYTPSVRHARRLVAQGAIGAPTEAECISHFNLERGIPFGWSHRAEQGGGRLNNNFTHTLSIVSSVVGDKILRVAGELRDDLCRAPIVAGVHDFTKRRNFIPENLNDPSLQWGESNVEWSYTVLAQFESPFAGKPVSALFRHGALVPRFHEDHIVFYGMEGAIYLKGHYGSGQLYLWGKDQSWQEVPLPRDIADDTPRVEGETEQCWHHLVRDFVGDIRGEAVEPYPTFRDGCRYQLIIDQLRQNGDWAAVPDPDADLPQGGCE